MSGVHMVIGVVMGRLLEINVDGCDDRVQECDIVYLLVPLYIGAPPDLSY